MDVSQSSFWAQANSTYQESMESQLCSTNETNHLLPSCTSGHRRLIDGCDPHLRAIQEHVLVGGDFRRSLGCADHRKELLELDPILEYQLGVCIVV